MNNITESATKLRGLMAEYEKANSEYEKRNGKHGTAYLNEWIQADYDRRLAIVKLGEEAPAHLPAILEALRWVQVEERLPELNECFKEVVDQSGTRYFARYFGEQGWIDENEGGGWIQVAMWRDVIS